MQVGVSIDNALSSDCQSTNGVKQGCILVNAICFIYLAAMLEVVLADSSEGVMIQTRKVADLFNLSHFRAKTKTSRKIRRELLFADDSTPVSHSAIGMQRLVNQFARAAEDFSQKIIIEKTRWSNITLGTLKQSI